MFTIFLVEDEYAVRERMKRSINWEENGFILIGEAGDGEIAYSKILENKPDIVITDIKMPFMDGLELSRLLRESMPQIKILILSGYDDFKYAKEAISIGVTDYLLKPITSKKLIEAIKKVSFIIEKERVEEKQLKKQLLSQEISHNQAKKSFFNELVTCRYTPIELINRAKELDIELVASSYNIILIKVFLEDATSSEYSVIHKSLNQKLDVWCKEHKKSILFNREEEGWAILFKKTLGEIEDTEENIIDAIQNLIKECSIISYCMGVGQRVERLSELSISFDAANKALAYRYLLNDENVIYYNQLNEYKMIVEDDTLSITDVDVTGFEQHTLNDFLKIGLSKDIESFSRDYLKSMGGGSESVLFRQYIMMDIYLGVVHFVEQLGYEKTYILEECGDIKDMTARIQTKEKAICYLKELLLKALKLRDAISSKRYHALLEEAKAYIEKNYNKESISLNDVADYVHISASHFSAVFSQEMGQTFISYLTEVRMKKAKELLRCSNMKTLEIGLAVGYKDPHYFSYLFKKTQNRTPKEYRKLDNEES